MVITFAGSGPSSGPRPLDPARDFPQLARLLRTVFAEELDLGGRHVFDHTARAGSSPLFWRLDPFLARLTPGFVWLEDGRIVGNVTLIPTQSPHRFLVANVAILPDYRRRGIARALMELVQQKVRERGGAEIRLQVKRGNEAAEALYASLGYSILGTVTTWRYAATGAPALPAMEGVQPEIAVAELPRPRWLEAYELDVAAMPNDLNWPDPLQRDAYQRTLRRRLTDFLSGKQFETWVIEEDSERLIALGAIAGEWGRPHQLRLRVHPDYQGELEATLLSKLLRRLRLLPRRRVHLAHDADDQVMNQLLPRAKFRPQDTLTHMCLKL